MNDPIPVELLEAQRRIRAAQVGDLGIPKIPERSIETALDRLKATLEKAPTVPNAKFDAKDRQAKIDDLRAYWNAPARHLRRGVFDPTAKEWNSTLEMLKNQIGTGFLYALVGTRGPGKTQMAVELMRATTLKLRSAYYCTAMDYFTRIKDSFAPDSERTQAEAQRFFGKFKLLVMDEINVRSDSAWEDAMLSDLIGKRYNAELDTLLIGNQTSEEFCKSVGPSIVSRLNECGGICVANWPSFR